jgi:[amino group carrier protein]-lysine/ornithine hydrolase
VDSAAVLERLVARYSPSGQEAGAVAEFLRLARELGYRARADRAGNGIAEVGRGRPTTLFLGHIDTVEGRTPVARRRGRVHGRGSVDAKGALAAALLAGRGFAGPGTFRVAAAVGEETDSRGARHLARGPRPDAVIAGEPSGWDGVTIGYKGDLRLEATFEHARSHWSSPFPTATEAAIDWLGRLRVLAESRRGESPFRSLGAKAVGFASDPAADPEVARITVDLRLPPGLSTAELLELLPKEPTRPRLRVLVRVEPTEVPRTDPVVVALGTAIRAEGGRPTLWRRTGTSDLNVVARTWGLGGAAYGPGDSRLDHTARESLSIAELERASAVVRGALAQLSRRRGEEPTPPRSADAP